MLSNIIAVGYQNRKIWCFNFPGATSADVLTKIDDVLNNKPASLIVHVGKNNLTNDKNLLINLKRIISKTNKTSSNTILTFSNTIFWKYNKNLEKTRADNNSRLKNWQKRLI